MPEAEVAKTALETALMLATTYLQRAAEQRRQSARACIWYLEAARAAIRGLEEEADEMLIRAMVLGRFESDAEHERQLFERVSSYLGVDKLRPKLADALEGINQCHNELV